MSLHFEDIPVIESAGRLGRRTTPEAEALADAYRLPPPPEGGLLGTLGQIRGLNIAGLMRNERISQLAETRGARAAPSYTTHSGCGGFNYDATCSEACFGFEPHHMDPFYCGTCAEQAADPANNPPYFWHFVGVRGSIQYKDMESNACAGRDAWKWDVAPCGDCQSQALFRCHDGYKKYPGNASWDPTICQGLVICDGQLKTC